MIKINPDQLHDGDIILVHDVSWQAQLIQIIDGTDWCHAAIYLGNGQIGEVTMADGLSSRTIDTSVGNVNKVLVKRLKALPDTMNPVISKANSYMSQKTAYAYNQIILLAILILTRKIPLNPILSELVRGILDNAAELLAQKGNGQPMICSEFVYRCYDEAVMSASDPYALHINQQPPAKQMRLSVSSGNAQNYERIDNSSLLAWAAASAVKENRTLKSVNPLQSAKAAPKKKKSEKELEKLAMQYLAEIKKPPQVSKNAPMMMSLDMEASLKTPETLDSIIAFSDALYNATAQNYKPKSGKNLPLSAPAPTAIPSSLEFLTHAIADFVTPGDLYRCFDLMDVETFSS